MKTLSIAGVSASVETMHITNGSMVTSLSRVNVSECTERLYEFILEILLANHRKLAQEVLLLILEVANSSLGRNPQSLKTYSLTLPYFTAASVHTFWNCLFTVHPTIRRDIC
jgi:hypothetical protein